MYTLTRYISVQTCILKYVSFNQIHTIHYQILLIKYNYEQLQLFEFKSVYMNTIRIIIHTFYLLR